MTVPARAVRSQHSVAGQEALLLSCGHTRYVDARVTGGELEAGRPLGRAPRIVAAQCLMCAARGTFGPIEQTEEASP